MILQALILSLALTATPNSEPSVVEPSAASATAPAAITQAAGLPPAPPETTDVGEAQAESELDDLLTLSKQEKDDVAVAAANKYSQRARKTPANVTVISGKDLRAFQYRTLPEALRGIAGMFSINDSVYEYFNVRGFGLTYDLNTRVLLLLNGHPMTAGLGTGGLHDMHIDLDAVDRIEVIKGPGGSLYGNFAFFAVVNVITRDADDPLSNRAAVRGGFPVQSAAAMVSNGGRSGDLSWFVTTKARRDEGIERYYGIYDPAKRGASDRAALGGLSAFDQEEMASGYGKVAYKGLSFQLYGSGREKQLPDGPFEADFPSESNRYGDQRYFGEAAYQGEAGRLTYNTRIFLDSARWEDYLRYTGYGLYRDMVLEQYGGAELRTVWKLPAGNTLLAGGEVARHAASLPSGFVPDFRAQYETGRQYLYTSTLVYAQNDWQATRALLFSAGAQANLNTLYKPAFLPRVGIVFTPAEAHTIKALYGQGIRQPTVYERFFEDFNSFIANPALHPEIIHTTELMYEVYPTERLLTSASVYFNSYDSLIVDQQVEVAANDFRSQFQNTPGFTSRGVELTAGYEFPWAWKGEVNGAVQDVRAEQTGLRPENSPTFLANLLLSGPLVKSLNLAVDWHLVSPRWRYDRSVQVGGYHVGNAALLYSTPFQPLSVGLRVTNVLDRKYDDPGSSEHDPVTKIPQRGRTGVLQVAVQY